MQGAHEARAKFDAMVSMVVSIEVKAQAVRPALGQGRYPHPELPARGLLPNTPVPFS